MSAPSLFERDSREPLGWWSGPGPTPGPLVRAHVVGFEFSSRGDRVPGRLLLPPDGPGPHPLVLLQHGAGGSKSEPYMDAAAGPWVRGGAAVASVDFPLHGDRADAKLAARLLGLLAGESRGDPNQARALVVDFVRQAVIDLHRALDALLRLPEIDAGRIAYAGFSLGSIIGATFCGLDPRPRAAALALGGGGMGLGEVDPVRYVGRIAPRPILFVGALRDERIPRAATEALVAAAGEPREIQWFDTTHSELPGAAFKAMWVFLRRHLEVPGSD